MENIKMNDHTKTNTNLFKPKIDSQCINCPNRRVGCHAVCESYREYRKAIDKLKAETKKRKAIALAAYSTHSKKLKG